MSRESVALFRMTQGLLGAFLIVDVDNRHHGRCHDTRGIPDWSGLELDPASCTVAAFEAVLLWRSRLSLKQGTTEGKLMSLYLPSVGRVCNPILVSFDIGRGQNRIAEDLLSLRIADDDAPAWRLGDHQAHGNGPEHSIQACPFLIERRLSSSDVMNIRGGADPPINPAILLERVDAAHMPAIAAIAGTPDTQLDVVPFSGCNRS